MVKRIILAVLLIVPVVAWAQSVKLGKVDKVALFNAMPEKAEAEAQIKYLSDQYKKEYDQLRIEYNRKYADFQAMSADSKTPATIKERRMQELQENNDKIEQFMKNAAADLKQKETELIAPLKSKIDEAVTAVGEAGGYLLIYDVSEKNIAYTSSAFEDVTPLVASQLGMK